MNVLKYLFKKLFFVFVMLLCFFIPYKMVSNAAILPGNWYSDEEYGGYWSFDPKVYPVHLNNAVSMTSYISNAVNKWSAAGINSSITMSQTYGNIKFYSGTRAQLNTIGFAYDNSINGQTIWIDSTTVSSPTAYFEIKKLNQVDASICHTIDSGLYEHVALHEYGHALGWGGHASGTSNVMYAYSVAENVTLTYYDKKQILQIYEEMR